MIRRRSIAAAAAAALLGSACSGLPGTEVLPPAPPAEGAVEGGELRVGIVRPGSIHPTLAASPGGRLVSGLVCDTLVHLDPETGEVLPGLAEELVVSGDGLAVTFKLRKGIPMHDGRELTARDVFYAVHRLVDPDEGSYHADLLAEVVGFGQFSGRELEEGQERPDRMAGVQVLERYGIQFRLTVADPNFVRAFAHPATAPISEEAYEANPLAFARDPVCAGPYEVDGTYDPDGQELVLVRDDLPPYAPGHSNGGRGYAERIRFHLLPDEQAVLDAYAAGTVDVAHVPSARLAEFAGVADVVEGPDPHVEYIGLPPAGLAETFGIDVRGDEAFNEVAVRHALSLALDREAVAERAYGGARLPARSFTPPSAGTYAARDAAGTSVDAEALDRLWARRVLPDELVRDGAEVCPSQLPPAADLPRAQRLLSDFGILGPAGGRALDLRGVTVPFYYNDEFGNAALAAEVARQWEAALGLKLELVPLTWEQFLDRANSGQGFDGFYRLSWSDPALNPTNYLRPLVQAHEDGPNFSRFADDRLDTLISELRQLGGGDHLVRYREIEEVVCAVLPAIPVTFARSRWLVRGDAVAAADEQVVGWDGLVRLRELYVAGT